MEEVTGEKFNDLYIQLFTVDAKMSRMVIRDSTRRRRWTRPLGAVVAAGIVALGPVAATPLANADNLRLNQGVITNVDTIKKQAGCNTDLRLNLQLQAAGHRQADDMLNNRNLDGDIGSDGSTVQGRARAAGYTGTVAETVATI